MPTVLSGRDGSIEMESGYSVKVDNIQITYRQQKVETPGIGDDWDTHLRGRQGWTATYECHIDEVTYLTAAAAGHDQLLLLKANLNKNTTGTPIWIGGECTIEDNETAIVTDETSQRARFTVRGEDAIQWGATAPVRPT